VRKKVLLLKKYGQEKERKKGGPIIQDRSGVTKKKGSEFGTSTGNGEKNFSRAFSAGYGFLCLKGKKREKKERLTVGCVGNAGEEGGLKKRTTLRKYSYIKTRELSVWGTRAVRQLIQEGRGAKGRGGV